MSVELKVVSQLITNNINLLSKTRLSYHHP